MNSSNQNRDRRPARLLTVMLWLALYAGFAPVGQAQEPSSLVIKAARPDHTEFTSSIREEIHESTQTTVWMTHVKVRADLDLKLGRNGRKYQAAIAGLKKRG